MKTLFTMGYARWPNNKRIDSMMGAMKTAGVDTLVDIRHSPCSSNPSGDSNYGPKEWNLQTAGSGIVERLERVGIDYRWLVELGNPQKRDQTMAVLREHIESGDDVWPVNRGLKILAALIEEGKSCCLLCACAKYAECHRMVIAETMCERFFANDLDIRDLTTIG